MRATSIPKRKAGVKFHYPFGFPNRKTGVGVHYSFWNFCFQFEKPNHFSTIHFGTFAPKRKGGTVGVELSFWNMNEIAKSISHYPFWNRCPNWETQSRNFTIQLDRGKHGDAISAGPLSVGGVGGCACRGGEHKRYSYCIDLDNSKLMWRV